MQQRICSSLVAGINTAMALLKGVTLHEEFDDSEEDVALQTDEERAALEQLLHRLKQIDSDPKFEAVVHFLINEGWLEHGCKHTDNKTPFLLCPKYGIPRIVSGFNNFRNS